ncbi:hypothetical protein O181_095295 [Austropuccinia psidii MF-1]|uniref:DUF4939 domain-containing protein n=1 Tax=Austropuccinia psidii MF-1 TaxID=1389203 RepID=A0A9Q3J5B8_9BASI|nr:hypothetical protein [Austropuccinia psidii MF-1]
MSRTTFRGPGEDGEEEEENSVEEEESDGTEAGPACVGVSEGTSGPTLAQSANDQIMGNLQASASSEVSRPPAFNTPSMKAPECFDRTQAFKVRSFIQSCQLIFHNDPENFSQDRKKVLYSTSFLIGRAAKWIEPYLSNLNNQDSSYLLNSWPLFSRIGDWGESALIHHFRKGIASRILDQLASHPSNIDSLQDIMDISLELDTRYHERQKEKTPEASKSNSSHNQNSSRSSHEKRSFHSQKRDKPHSSLLNKDFKLKGSEKERRIKEGLCTYCGGKHSLESCVKRPQNKLTQPSGSFPSQGKA